MTLLWIPPLPLDLIRAPSMPMPASIWVPVAPETPKPVLVAIWYRGKLVIPGHAPRASAACLLRCHIVARDPSTPPPSTSRSSQAHPQGSPATPPQIAHRDMSIQARVEALEAIIGQHERKIVMLEAEVARQARELAVARGPIPQVVSRGGHKYVKRDPVVRAATLARTAAKARASKAVGEGKGAVRSQRTAARMQKQMQQLDVDEQAAIDSGTRGRARKKGYRDGRRG